MSRRRARRGADNIELNVTAMLDMAFQLLAFFVLTFKPATVESVVGLRLPPPEKVKVNTPANQQKSDKPPEIQLESLIISVPSTPAGDRTQMKVNGSPVRDLEDLSANLQRVLSDKDVPVEQVIVEAGENLQFQELMKVVDRCLRQKLASGEAVSKLSIVPLK